MKFTWDEPKRSKNLAARGLDFAALDASFFEGSVVVPARQQRFMSIGPFEGKILAVVFTLLGTEAVSVISMRQAS